MRWLEINSGNHSHSIYTYLINSASDSTSNVVFTLHNYSANLNGSYPEFNAYKYQFRGSICTEIQPPVSNSYVQLLNTGHCPVNQPVYVKWQLQSGVMNYHDDISICLWPVNDTCSNTNTRNSPSTSLNLI